MAVHPFRKEVLDVLREIERPVTSQEIADRLGITRDQAKGACLSLRYSGKVIRRSCGKGPSTWEAVSCRWVR